MRNLKQQAAVLIGIAAFLMAACGGNAAPTASPAPSEPTSRFSTSIAVDRATLPATWTPTATYTPTPTPTITDTPTITVTPSPTVTRTAEEICEVFRASLVIISNREYQLTDQVDYFAGYDDPAGEIEFVGQNHTTGEEYHLRLPAGSIYVGKMQLSALPGAGDYTLTIQLNLPGQPALCSFSVDFTIRPRSPLDVLIDALSTLNAPQTPTVTPNFQATLDAEITSEAE